MLFIWARCLSTRWASSASSSSRVSCSWANRADCQPGVEPCDVGPRSESPSVRPARLEIVAGHRIECRQRPLGRRKAGRLGPALPDRRGDERSPRRIMGHMTVPARRGIRGAGKAQALKIRAGGQAWITGAATSTQTPGSAFPTLWGTSWDTVSSDPGKRIYIQSLTKEVLADAAGGVSSPVRGINAAVASTRPADRPARARRSDRSAGRRTRDRRLPPARAPRSRCRSPESGAPSLVARRQSAHHRSAVVKPTAMTVT